MLSSTADQLFWTGRYMERAESTARILDVSYRSALMHAGVGGANEEWRTALAVVGDPDFFAAHFGEPTPDGVIAYMALDADNPSSILSCIDGARQNARALRATITSEMWESLNLTWLEMRRTSPETLSADGVRTFFDWVKYRSHLFRGVTYGTMLHSDGFHFVRLGTYVERADNTARLIDTKLRVLSLEDGTEGALDYYRWGAVLRALSAFRAYRQVYKDVITPTRVAELLLLRADMPRSLHFCFDQITTLLNALAHGKSLESQRLAGEIHARLRFGRIADIMRDDLHEFLEDVLRGVREMAAQIGRDFMMTA